ncbi:helix-turn-helix domain-containing protein [Hymenobacter terrenus]|uniref:helix-turn-helix domain-containing protein n=1 Tax=Hymenobacter terrenus TaxID=1629124 RepID=UPI001E28763D|nr:helix-turn-helix transcriptional regulator [Hymenobacter terrenus]
MQANYAAVVPLRFEPETDPNLPLKSPAPALQRVTPSEVVAPTLIIVPAPGEAELAVTTTPVTDSLSTSETLTPAAPTLAPELQPWREKLLRLMAEEQPWLEPELTLAELAHRLRTNTSLLSHVINTGCGQNFNDFVNSYRVVEAERKLQDPRLAHYSLVGIALECGFNSKSTFNRVFKKLTGRTPGEVGRSKS